jgi:hypothetical protein
MANENLTGNSSEAAVPAIKGECTGPGGFGVLGICDTGAGVVGESTSSKGVIGKSQSFVGVFGTCDGPGFGVIGTCNSGPGVRGQSVSGRGMEAASDTNYGLRSSSRTFAGIRTSSVDSPGIESNSINSHGILATCDGAGTGVVGLSKTGIGVHGKGGKLAGFFEGDVEVTGDVRCLGADFAEDFDISGADKVEAGTVMVLGNEGALLESQQPYDKRVAGVISGAGDYRPGILLDYKQTPGNRQAVALMGKVFCKVDAQFGAIEVGDLLTTSPTPGHAMKTSDPFRAFGAVIGKALRPLTSGRGLVPILIALQ